MTELSELMNLMREQDGVLVDTRPLGEYLDKRLPRSACISIPTLIFKRLRKGVGSKMDWKGMKSFVNTPEGKEVWSAVKQGDRVVIIGSSGWDDTARALLPILQGVHDGRVTLLRGGWQAVEADPELAGLVIASPAEIPPARPPPPLRSATLPTPIQGRTPLTAQSDPPEPTFNIAPPTPPTDSHPRLSNQISMPSLRAQRGQPGSVMQTNTGKRPPKLSLNVDRPLRSATAGSFPKSPIALKSPGLLKIDTTMGNGLSIRSPTAASFDVSSQPRSPRSFGDTQGDQGEMQGGPSRPLSPFSTARPYSEEPEPIPRTAVMTARHAMSPFIVSTILPGFLYLGPEITNDEDVEALQQVGVKRILNVAMECDDESELGLKRVFERYLKIPMRDTVEESGVGKGMSDACDFLGEYILDQADER